MKKKKEGLANMTEVTGLVKRIGMAARKKAPGLRVKRLEGAKMNEERARTAGLGTLVLD